MAELREETSFAGQAIATSIDQGAEHLRPFISQADLIVYTPSCRRRLLPLLDQHRNHVAIAPLVSHDGLDYLRQVVPG